MKRTDKTEEERAHKASPSGLAGWLIAVFTRLTEGSWRSRATAHERQMKLVETLSLGGRRQLMLVSCGGERLLIGVGPDSVDSMIRVADGSPLSTNKSAKTLAGPWS